jgi:predicted metalloprotease with PDZ domain
MKSIQFKLLSLIIFFLSSCTASKVVSQLPTTNLSYVLEMPNPHTHYFDVTMKVNNAQKIAKDGKVQVKMATWTPGSYLIREYARNIDNVNATANGKTAGVTKINKNTWEIDCGTSNEVVVEYSIYCYELTVRTSYLDDTHGYINGASVFMYVPELMKDKATLTVKPHASFSKVSTALKNISGFNYEIKSFDELVDSPIEIGNQELLYFEAAGVRHTIAMYSNQSLVYDKEEVLSAYKKVVNAATGVVGEHPCKEYLFIVHHLPGIGGGLEHLYSTTCQTSPAAYASERAFRGFMGLIAHEYFHLWNVKRIHPEALGPFDYENENYTHLLWVSEGFTSFYQDDLIRRAGMMSEDDYLRYMASDLNSIENSPGQEVQAVAESSWDAWIKYYRRNENSQNTTVSYYSKGGVIGLLLNIEILAESKGDKSLDDVMKYLWEQYYKKQNRGFTDAEMQQACEVVAGKSLQSFFDNYVWGTTAIDYDYFFNKAGLSVSNELAGEATPYFGACIRGDNVSNVVRDSGAYTNGIYVGDEILEVNGLKFTDSSQLTDGKKIGDSVKVKVKRSGAEFTYDIPLLRNPAVNYSLSKMTGMTVDQAKVYNKLVHN